jgi:hypothetical protein
VTQEYGHVVYGLPSGEPSTYPSAFSVLNALWCDLSLCSAVQVVNCQIALQAFLLVGLVVEAGAAIRGRMSWEAAAVVVLVGAFAFGLPTSGNAAFLEITPRLSHKALLLLPLTLVVRLSPQAPGPRLRVAVAGVAAFCAGWAPALNPALAIVELPVLLATLAASGIFLRSGESLRPPARAGAVAACGALAMLPLAADPWIRNLAGSGARLLPAVSSAAAVGGSAAHLDLAGALAAGFRHFAHGSALFLFPAGCTPSPLCTDDISLFASWLPALLYLCALAWLFRRGWNARWALVLVLWLGSAAALFLEGAAGALISGGGLEASLLRVYAAIGLSYCGLAFFLLLIALALALAGRFMEERTPHGDRLAVLGALLAAMAINLAVPEWVPGLLRHAVASVSQHEEDALGRVLPADVALVKRAAQLVPDGERVLLVGLPVRFDAAEVRTLPVSTSRAVGLYTDLASMFGFGFTPFGPNEYRRRVCRRLDLKWLADHRVLWVVASDRSLRRGCVHAFDDARPRYFEEIAREGDAALFRLRADRLREASLDPALDEPLAQPTRGTPGRGVAGEVEMRGPIAVAGWACDLGSASPVTVELELADAENPARVYFERHLAAQAGGAAATRACGGPGHGFGFAPVAAPEGKYRARLFAYDGAGKRRSLLAEGFIVELNF